MAPLAHILSNPPPSYSFEGVASLRSSELRKLAKFWGISDASKMSLTKLRTQLPSQLTQETGVRAALSQLSVNEREVVRVVRRYGCKVNGTVLSVDLQVRGLVKKIEGDRPFSFPRWKVNPIPNLRERYILLNSDGPSRYSMDWHWHSSTTDPSRPFPTSLLHPLVYRIVPPAGPPDLPVPALKAEPGIRGYQPPAQTARELARVLAHVGSKRSVRVNQNGQLSNPSLRALIKAVPLAEDPDFPLPERQGLLFEILRQANILEVDGNQMVQVNEQAANQLFNRLSVVQVRLWVHSWLHCGYWNDGWGVTTSPEGYYQDRSFLTARQVLAWALGALAHKGRKWFSLQTFLNCVRTLLGSSWDYGYYGNQAGWDPDLEEARDKEAKEGEARHRAYWAAGSGRWLANALMVTLPSLGVVERGQHAHPRTADCFRLTPLGRAIFGAPEIQLEEQETQPFLLVQPNFDVLVYVQEADVRALALLGSVLEGEGSGSGPVQKYRLTQQGVYAALEAGVTVEQIVQLLRDHARSEVPGNVVHTLESWANRRERMTLHQAVTLVGFPRREDRDAFLSRHRDAKALGDFFVQLQARGSVPAGVTPELTVTHHHHVRHSIQLDEEGTCRSTEPYDIVQWARLRRIAVPADGHWRVTAKSVRSAVDSGHKWTTLVSWLNDHLGTPMPSLFLYTLQAWADKAPPLALGQATLLHVSDHQLFLALLNSERVRPLLVGSPGPGWLAVRPDSVKPLSRLLKEMGFTVDSSLPFTFAPVDPMQLFSEPEPTQPARDSRKRSRRKR